MIILRPHTRQAALDLIRKTPDGHVVTVKEPTRTLEQNAKLWAMLADVSRAQPEGRQWGPETWKCAFLHALGHRARFEPGIDDTGPFPVAFSSSRLTKAQMADLITTIYEYGDRHGVRWSEPEREWQ